MARPRVIKHPSGGEIVLKNIPTEEADKIKELLLGTKAASEPDPEVKETASSELNRKAHSFCKHAVTGKWIYVEVSFNEITKEAEITKVMDRHDKWEAIEQFKLEVEKNLLV